MKLRHAAALALVGWYLMAAPTLRDPRTDSFAIDVNAPLQSWQILDSYYSAAECETAERDLVETAAQYPNVIPFYTVCVATDDPRVRGLEPWLRW